jgi:putative aminopeptidase FrvX
MIQRIRLLSEAYGPSGAEQGIRSLILKELNGLTYDVETDTLGNLIVSKPGNKPNGKPICLVTSMDENGLMVVDRDPNGFLRVGNVGVANASQWVGQRVVFENGTIGIVQAEPVKDCKELTFSHLYIDLGDSDSFAIEVGDVAVLHATCVDIGGDRLTGKALANRSACAVLIEVLHRLHASQVEVMAVFSTQHQVGSRGVRTALFPHEPAVVIAVGAIPAQDTPNAKAQSPKLGQGPVIVLKERNFILSSTLRDKWRAVADERGIPYQFSISQELVTDAGQAAVSKTGIPAVSLAAPLRYPNTANELVHRQDLEYLVQLISGWVDQLE